MAIIFQQTRGLSAHITGLLLLPMMVPLAFNPILTGRIVGRIGARIPMTAGFGLGAVGTLLQVWTQVNTSYVITMISLLLIGFGCPLRFPR